MMIPIVILTMENESDRGFMIRIYTEYYAMMKGQAIVILKNESLAEDILQTVCLRLIEHFDTIREMDQRALTSYIMTTTKHTAYKHLRQRYERDKKATPPLEYEDGGAGSGYQLFIDETVNIEASVVFEMTIQDLKRALCRLPQKYQDVLEYKYMLEMNDAEIGEALGIGAGSVRTYLTRARKAAYAIAKEMGV